MKSNYWSAIFLLTGTTIGVGVFGIPFVTQQVGYVSGMVWLIILGLVTVLTNVAYAYVVVYSDSFKGLRQFAGYAQDSVGVFGKYLGMLIVLFGQWGSGVAYLIGIGSFLAVIFNLYGSESLLTVLVFLSVAVATWFKVRFLASVESWLTIGMIGVIALIMLSGAPYIDYANFELVTKGFSISTGLVLYGVFMAALSGSSIVPEMAELLKNQDTGRFDTKKLFSAVVIGSAIPVVVYALFLTVVLGISGDKVTEESIQGLVPFLDIGIVRFGAVFGIMAMLSSYLTLSFVSKDMFMKDFNLPKLRAWMLAVLPPFFLFLSGLRSFIKVLDLTGIWLGTATILMVLFMFVSVRKRSVDSE